jgi:copper homeostasis protein
MYSQQELAVMEADIAAAAKLGAQGVALGCLDADGSVDAPATSQLAHFAREHGLQVTFHRAFDMARSLRYENGKGLVMTCAM